MVTGILRPCLSRLIQIQDVCALRVAKGSDSVLAVRERFRIFPQPSKLLTALMWCLGWPMEIPWLRHCWGYVASHAGILCTAPLCLQLKTARARTLLTTPDALYWLVPRRPFKRSTIAWKGKFVIPLHLLCATSSACLMACEFA